MKRIAAIAVGLYYMVSAFSLADELTRIEEKKARTLFAAHLKELNKSTDDYKVSLRAFGKSTWIVSTYRKRFSGPVPWRYIINSRGDINELTLDSLANVFINEYPESQKKQEQEQLINEFVKLHAGKPVAIVSNTSDIAGYAKAPLDADIADALRAPFSFGKLTTVVYTYQQIGGIVRRYRFTFEKGKTFRKVECAEVGRAIGNAQYYR